MNTEELEARVIASEIAILLLVKELGTDRLRVQLEGAATSAQWRGAVTNMTEMQCAVISQRLRNLSAP